MSESTPLATEVDRRLDVGIHLIGIGIAIAAAYHTGQTGNWVPLLAATVGLSLVVLFVTSE